jgi:glycosyltransferase involved in cell wall biosynthesis
MINAAKGLTAAGHNVFLASKDRSEILAAAKDAGVKTCVFNIRWDLSPLNTVKIAKFLRKSGIDIVVCNLNKDVRVAGLAARMAGTPAVIARHGVQLCAIKWRHKLTLTHLTDGILTNTKTIKDAYSEYSWFEDNFVRVIYNGIEEKSSVQPYDFSEDFPGKKIVFSAGRLTEQKGFRHLIEAAAILGQKRDDTIFLIAGKGRLEGQLKKLVNTMGLDDKIHFLGFRENIDSYMTACDLFVLPSLFEGMPNVVMEAMASGKAVVATDVNGARELMMDEETGIIVPPANPEALAESMGRLLDDDKLRFDFGQNGRKRVRDHFTVSRMIDQLEDYFSAIRNGRIGQ